MLDTVRMQTLDFRDICAGNLDNPNQTLIERCNLDETFLQSAVLPFEIATGGMLGLLFWAVISVAVYLKYQNFILAALVGVPVLLTSTIAFPDRADTYITLLLILGIATSVMIVIWRIPRD
ncbi:MAG: hypothetical protein OXQ29_04775 [Rhodospirillaceae bacterium]|nr:hypothetical protein [Rhodospirillaceae bacterium]